MSERKIVDYIVLHSDSVIWLGEKVQIQIKKGYQPYFGVFTAERISDQCYQVMVKYKEVK